jgi:hydrogenase expression/formation protein HypC
MEIVEIDGDTATCTIDTVSVKASVALVPHAKVGDWAIIHAGFAIEIMNEKEAKETLRLFEEIEQAYRQTQEDNRNKPERNLSERG